MTVIIVAQFRHTCFQRIAAALYQSARLHQNE